MKTQGLVQDVSKLFPNIGNYGKEGELGKYRYSSPKVCLYDHVKRDGTRGIYIQLIVDRKKDRIPLYINVRAEDFDGMLIKKKVPGAAEDNLYIDSCLARLNEIYKEFRLSREELTLDKLLYNYNNYDLRIDFIPFMEKAIKSRAGELARNSVKQHEFLLAKLKDFKPVIKFSDIDTNFLKEFNSYLKGLKNNDNTRRKNFEHLKGYINMAIKSGIRLKNPFTDFVMPTATDRIVFLSPDELQMMINYYYKPGIKEHHKRVLAGWLFMAFTSLRVGDAVRLDETMIYGETLVFVPEKTKRNGKTVSIHLTPQALMFMNGIKGKLIKYYSQWQANKYIKEVAKLVGINKVVTNHVARHTFATVFLINGGDPVTLQKILGHSDFKHTLKYTHITEPFKKSQTVKVHEKFTIPTK
jgi:integrase/recombinase XerD